MNVIFRYVNGRLIPIVKAMDHKPLLYRKILKQNTYIKPRKSLIDKRIEAIKAVRDVIKSGFRLPGEKKLIEPEIFSGSEVNVFITKTGKAVKAHHPYIGGEKIFERFRLENYLSKYKKAVETFLVNTSKKSYLVQPKLKTMEQQSENIADKFKFYKMSKWRKYKKNRY